MAHTPWVWRSPRFRPEAVRAVLFDIDGTLRDTDDEWVHRLSRWLRPLAWLGREHWPRAAARALVMAAETPFNWLYTWADRLHLDNLLARGLGGRRRPVREGHGYRLVPGVRAMLDALVARYPLGVVSAGPAGSTEGFLEATGLRPYFQVVVSGQTYARTKPHPEPVRRVAEALGVPPQAALMVGDTTVDIRAGRAAGAQTVGVLCGFGTARELRRAGADLLLPGTAMLTEILEVGR